MFHMWGQGYGMGWLWVFILWALIIGVVAVAIYVLLNSRKHNQGSSANVNLRQGNAVDMVKERYAKGEISREEYKQMMEDLKE